MNLSLQLYLISIVGPCLLAFIVGYVSNPLASSNLLSQGIIEAIGTSSFKEFLTSLSSDSSSSLNGQSSLHIIQWNHYVRESVNSDRTEPLLNERLQVNLTENAKRAFSDSHQVFVEVRNVDSVFLDSQRLVEDRFVEFIKSLEIDVFTYECHRLSGVRCTGYAGEDIFSLYTWPNSRFLSLNVLSNLKNSWVSIVPLASHIFAVPMASTESNLKEPSLIWSLKQRVMGTSKLNWMTYKPSKPNLSSVAYKSGIASYEVSTSGDGVYVKPDSASTDRDRKTNNEQKYGVVYSEVLVHPVMFAHENPKRVAIIGNGTGSTLREVLKHNTVEKVVVVNPDEDGPKMNRQAYPQHSDCRILKGSTQSCYDDTRVEIVATEILEWVSEEEGDDSDVDSLFDVIIVENSDTILQSPEYLEKILDGLSESLSTNGALVFPHGVLQGNTEQKLFETLVEVGFEAVHRYEEFDQQGLLSFVACFHNQESRALWFASAAELHVRMQSRLIGTVSESIPILHWFDEATMMNYHVPSRLVEDSFCSQPEKPYMCDEGHGFDPDVPNAPISSFAVGKSLIPGAGRGVFFQENVAKGTFIAADESVYDILIYPSTTSLFIEMIAYLDKSEFLHYSSLFFTYIYGYGFAFEYFGKPGYLVDTGILTFINHGCNGTGVMAEGAPIVSTEMTVDLDHMPPELENYGTETHTYNPFIDRNNMRIITAGDKTLRDVMAGSELLDNYLRYLHDGNWKAGVLDYRAQCIASGKGVVTGYEERKSSSVGTGEEFVFHPPLDII